MSIREIVFYEVQGTFTPEGTFEAIITRLRELKDNLGVPAIELMPVAQFRGTMNWAADVWKKVRNSRDHRWAGPGSSLPDCLPSAGNRSMRVRAVLVRTLPLR